MTLGLLALFVSGLLAATLLPVGSEPVLVAYLLGVENPQIWLAWLAIGVGNTLGGWITYAMGRGLRLAWQRLRAQPISDGSTQRASRWLDRFGPAALIMSWVPIVGDPLCLVAGSLRLPMLPCVFWMALGKFARYGVVIAITLQF
jgi:membrane protein YqaA with SNARE-associated domain